MRLVRSFPRSKELEDTVGEEHQVYQKYQMAIHKDPKSKVDMSQFEGFLVESPLIVSVYLVDLTKTSAL